MQCNCLLFQWVGMFTHQFNNKYGLKVHFEALSLSMAFSGKSLHFSLTFQFSQRTEQVAKVFAQANKPVGRHNLRTKSCISMQHF